MRNDGATNEREVRMAQILKMRWEGVTPEQYDALRPMIQLESDPPEGLISHVAWFRDDGIVVVDVWDSSAQFDDFMQSRLAPAIEQIGIDGQPELKWIDAHAYFAPAVPATAIV
jgi:hypothetical protein